MNIQKNTNNVRHTKGVGNTKSSKSFENTKSMQKNKVATITASLKNMQGTKITKSEKHTK